MANLKLVNDEAVARRERGRAREKHESDVTLMMEQQLMNAVYVEDKQLDVSNFDKQLGKPIFHTELEAKLAKILPSSIVFINHPTKWNFRAITRQTPTGLVTVCPYEKGLMPEHSVIKVHVEEFPDPDVLIKKKPISKADLPKYEYVPGRGYVFEENSERPGFKRRKVPWGEKIRGWRTVLIHCFAQNLLTVAEIEKYFGADTTAQWAGNLGKQNIYLPW